MSLFFKTKCPACGQSIEAPEEVRHTGIECPTCHTGFVPGAERSPRRFTTGHAIALGLVGLLLACFCVGEDLRGGLFFFGALIFGALIYFVPTMVARHHLHHQAQAIFILNLVAGWTFIGWVIALVWAFMRPARS